jgi:uncharacterized membrane protein
MIKAIVLITSMIFIQFSSPVIVYFYFKKKDPEYGKLCSLLLFILAIIVIIFYSIATINLCQPLPLTRL